MRCEPRITDHSASATAEPVGQALANRGNEICAELVSRIPVEEEQSCGGAVPRPLVEDPRQATMTRVVEILRFVGCPNVEGARRAVAAGIAQAFVADPVEVRVVDVADEEDARRLRFLGSPTVRVDGRDVEESSSGRGDFGLQCRVYEVEGRMMGCPPAAWICAALRSSRE